MTSQEQIIIKQLAADDPRAMGLLYDQYAPMLYGILVRMLRDEAMAQEVLHVSLINVWTQRAHYDPARGRLFTWLVTLCRHTALDALRSGVSQGRTRPHQHTGEAQQGLPLRTETYGDGMGLTRVLVPLEDHYRDVIDLIYFEGLTPAEVQQRLNLPLGTVKSRLRTALQHLRKLLQVPPAQEAKTNPKP
ncbi:RNA polymerase sigma-70 factor, ECF subfamily [Catalinimonas alkaloidigena]|uniref:RNA polymerase sigma-70 factor, ECF subfamily n=1 Tax=Catalinimonas alkaloidigena TaxID=1075417 RepID=A0A1G9UZ26_9BACT|nr:sigma-70 family RNA polymerase sigma factor [Catalinimonas alkaloidigena]SDM65251.1 RNA polymerase sigma-70 factor, ECF subfamily [Catalinimonas alkaloidigena]